MTMLTCLSIRSSRHSVGAPSSVEPEVAVAARVNVSWKGRPSFSPGISTGHDCSAGSPMSATDRTVP